MNTSIHQNVEKGSELMSNPIRKGTTAATYKRTTTCDRSQHILKLLSGMTIYQLARCMSFSLRSISSVSSIVAEPSPVPTRSRSANIWPVNADWALTAERAVFHLELLFVAFEVVSVRCKLLFFCCLIIRNCSIFCVCMSMSSSASLAVVPGRLMDDRVTASAALDSFEPYEGFIAPRPYTKSRSAIRVLRKSTSPRRCNKLTVQTSSTTPLPCGWQRPDGSHRMHHFRWLLLSGHPNGHPNGQQTAGLRQVVSQLPLGSLSPATDLCSRSALPAGAAAPAGTSGGGTEQNGHRRPFRVPQAPEWPSLNTYIKGILSWVGHSRTIASQLTGDSIQTCVTPIAPSEVSDA